MVIEMESTWPRVIRIWWALLWRHLVVAIGAMFCGGLIGALVGVVCVVAGADIKEYVWPLRIFGGLIGLIASTIPVKWILGRKFGDFRLVLVPIASSQTDEPNQPTQRNAGSRPSADDSPASEAPSPFSPSG